MQALQQITDDEMVGDWVTKTDLRRFIRCPYAFWLVDSGRLPARDLVDKRIVTLMREGIAFQGAVEETAMRLPAEPADLPRLFAKDRLTLLGLPVLENPDLKIRGAPDGVRAAAGALLPVEIKSHKNVEKTDELELAFYWLLLEPFRSRDISPPQGLLLLRRAGRVEPVEVELHAERFEEVLDLINDLRIARRDGVLPRVCDCPPCRRAQRELEPQMRSRGELTMIWGIGPRMAHHLEALDIARYEELSEVDPYALTDQLRQRGVCVSPSEVDRWRRQAASYASSQPEIFAQPPAISEPYFVLDVKYEAGGQIWLIGLCLVRSGRRTYEIFWANDEDEELDGLSNFAARLSAEPDAQVVTWAGKSADLPALNGAANRLGVPDLLGPLSSRHIDLFDWARDALRLPQPSFSLTDVASFFGVKKKSQTQDGLEANMKYGEYVSSSDAKRKAYLQKQLIDYNRADLECLIDTLETVREFTPNGEPIAGSLSPDIVAEWVEVLEMGKWAGKDVLYQGATANQAKNRARAEGQKVKAAILRCPENDFAESNSIGCRVWFTENERGARFALHAK